MFTGGGVKNFNRAFRDCFYGELKIAGFRKTYVSHININLGKTFFPQTLIHMENTNVFYGRLGSLGP